MYYTNWCGIYVKFFPEWERLVKMAESYTELKVVKVDCEGSPENERKCRDNKIAGFPTILIEMRDGNIIDYSGVRKAENILAVALDGVQNN